VADNISLDDWSGAGATKQLAKVVQENADAADRLSKRMFWLTVATVGLAVVQVLLAILQLYRG